MEKAVTEAIAYRRSVRVFKDEEIDAQKVEQCIKNASLAPNSSNLQLWEFYHITNKTLLKKMTTACLGQNAAKSAQQMVVFVVRKDLWKNRAKANIQFLKDFYGDKPESEYSKREKFAVSYYRKLIPTVYFDVFGILGWIKFLIFQVLGLFKPAYRQVRNNDLRIVAHKSVGLAAENFMVSMAAIGYDTCPMEGSDTLRVKRILNLPWRSEINMVVACGIRDKNGVYGPQFRVPFEEVYHQL